MPVTGIWTVRCKGAGPGGQTVEASFYLEQDQYLILSEGSLGTWYPKYEPLSKLRAEHSLGKGHRYGRGSYVVLADAIGNLIRPLVIASGDVCQILDPAITQTDQRDNGDFPSFVPLEGRSAALWETFLCKVRRLHGACRTPSYLESKSGSRMGTYFVAEDAVKVRVAPSQNYSPSLPPSAMIALLMPPTQEKLR